MVDVRWSSLALALLVMPACAELEEMTPGICGNGVVEGPEQGGLEECDSFAPADCGTDESDQPIACTCRAPGEPDECRFGCSPEDGGLCPSGYGCGSDGICRRPSGQMSEGPALEVDPETRLFAGDFDGDGLADLGTDGNWTLGVHFSASTRGIASSSEAPVAFSPPPVGDLSAASPAPTEDLVLLLDGLMVARGQTDQSLQPTIYASGLLPWSELRLVAMDARPYDGEGDLEFLGHEVMALTMDPASGTALFYLDARGLPPMKVGRLAGLQLDNVAGDVQTARLYTGDSYDDYCDQLVVAEKGASTVHVYSPCVQQCPGSPGPCAPGGWNYDELADEPFEPLAPVTLPAGCRVGDRGVLITHLNSDGHFDLVIDGGPVVDGLLCDGTVPLAGGTHQLLVTFGQGDGRFHSSLLGPIVGDPNNEVVVASHHEFDEFPLAIGQLRPEGYAEGLSFPNLFVLPQKVLISFSALIETDLANGTIGGIVPLTDPSYGWSWAVIGDLNASGAPDVIAAHASDPVLTFFNGVGSGLFNEFQIPLAAPAVSPAVGDFDGDLVLDFAFVEASSSEGASSGPSISICFGNAFGAPAAPVSMGRLSGIEQLAAGSLFSLRYDGISDMAVAARTATGGMTLTVFEGNSRRQLTSPFFFTTRLSAAGHVGERERPVAAALGQLGRSELETEDTSHRDIAVVTDATSAALAQDAASLAPHALWVLPSTAEAAIDASEARPLALPPDTWFTRFPPLAATVDLDDDDRDEVVLLADGVLWEPWGPAPETETETGMLLVAHDDVDALSGGWQWVSPASGHPVQQLGHLLFFNVPHELDVGSSDGGAKGTSPRDDSTSEVAYDGHIEVGDVNGDGADDVVALGWSAAELGGDDSPKLVVFLNEGKGYLDASALVELRYDGMSAPTSFALRDVDADPAPELVVSTADRIWIADMDVTAERLAGARELLDKHGEPLLGGRSLAVGDWDGDGVWDLAVAGDGDARIYYGEAVVP